MPGGIGDGGLDGVRERIRGGTLHRSPTRACLPQAQCCSTGHDMKPGTKCITDQKRSGLTDKDQECCLECVLDIMLVADKRTTHAPHHLGMPLHERGQDGLGYVAVVCTAGGLESFEELTVRQAYRGTDTVQGPQDPRSTTCHLPSTTRASRESHSATHGGLRLLDNHEYNGSAGGFVPDISGNEPKRWPKTQKRSSGPCPNLELVRGNVLEAALMRAVPTSLTSD